MGGDEFAVLLPGVGRPDLLERLAKALIAELAAPIRLDGLLLVLEASAGVCVYPQHADDAESLLRRADVAMGHAQRSRTGVARYDKSQDVDTPYRIGLLGDLRRALETGEVQLHYQPKVAFDGRVVGLEALLRWERPGRGRVSPDEFVGLAESSGLMPRLTDYVLEAAIGQLAAWRAHDLQVQVAVNVSPRDVLSPGFAQRVAEHLGRHQVPPTRSSWRSPSGCCSTTPGWPPTPWPSCAGRASGCRWTTSAPATPRWCGCAACRWAS